MILDHIYCIRLRFNEREKWEKGIMNHNMSGPSECYFSASDVSSNTSPDKRRKWHIVVQPLPYVPPLNGGNVRDHARRTFLI
jgi:hypothetical protein